MRAVYWRFGTTRSPVSDGTANGTPPVNANDCAPRVELTVAVALPV
jgi:hypothetical protein